MAQDSFAALPDLLHYQNRWWICGDVALGVANQVGTPGKVGGSSQWLPPKGDLFVVSRLWVFFFVLNLCLLIMVPSRFSWFLIAYYPSWCLSTWLGSSYFLTIYYSRVLMETNHRFSRFQF